MNLDLSQFFGAFFEEAEELLVVRSAAGKERTLGELYRSLIADGLDLAWLRGEFKGRREP